MKKAIIGLLILGIVVLSGCQSEKAIVCNKPYILVGTECCLDQNENNICDDDEDDKNIVAENKEPSNINSIEVCEAKEIEKFCKNKNLYLKKLNSDCTYSEELYQKCDFGCVREPPLSDCVSMVTITNVDEGIDSGIGYKRNYLDYEVDIGGANIISPKFYLKIDQVRYKLTPTPHGLIFDCFAGGKCLEDMFDNEHYFEVTMEYGNHKSSFQTMVDFDLGINLFSDKIWRFDGGTVKVNDDWQI